MRSGQAMGCAFIYLQDGVIDKFRGSQCRSANRYDLVIVTMNDKRRYIELLEVLGKVCLRERFDAVEGVLMSSLHSL